MYITKELEKNNDNINKNYFPSQVRGKKYIRIDTKVIIDYFIKIDNINKNYFFNSNEKKQRKIYYLN